MRTRTLWTLGLLTFSCLSLVVAGCGSDDDSPTGPVDPTVTDTDAVLAASFVTPAALSMVEASAAVAAFDLNGLAAPPDLGGLGRQALAREAIWSLGWDSETQEYFGTFTNDELPVMSMAFEHRVQYRDATGIAQAQGTESAETTDGARYRVEADVFMDLGALAQMQGGNGDMQGTVSADYAATTEISGLLGQEYTVSASGGYGLDLDITVQSEQGTQALDMDVDMDYALAMTMAPGGCPTGTATVDYAGYRMTMLFDGTSTANWTLTKLATGAQLVQGFETFQCGVAAANQ